jgi:hypothetical protein
MKNSIKDVQRGTANCDVLQEGNSLADHAHVSKATPLETKRKELEDDPRYRTEAAPNINKGRQQRTTRMRRSNVRPL